MMRNEACSIIIVNESEMFIKAIISSKMLDLHLSVLRWRCYGLIFSVSLHGEFVNLP